MPELLVPDRRLVHPLRSRGAEVSTRSGGVYQPALDPRADFARALKVPHPSAPGRFRAAKFTSSTGRPRAATTVCEACCGGGGGGSSDPRCCVIAGQTGSRAVGSVPNSFAAATVSTSVNITLTQLAIAETGAFPWSSQNYTETFNLTAVTPLPEYVENRPDRFVCSNIALNPQTLTSHATTVQQLVSGGTNTFSSNRPHRVTVAVRFGYQQSQGYEGLVTWTMQQLTGLNLIWQISAPVGNILVPGSTRPTQQPIPYVLNQNPPIYTPISYQDNPQNLGFVATAGGSRTYPQQGAGIREITETWNVDIRASGGPFVRCSQAAAGGTGCSDCGASGVGVGGALL